VNPAFEFDDVPKGQIRITLAGQRFDPGRYAWDGRTLWLEATITQTTELRVSFGAADGPRSP
jgi:hypothetical protein